jgi:archaeal flagellar protein FlaJ
MKFKIPLTFSDLETLKIKSRYFLPKIKYRRGTHLEENLVNSSINISREEYLAICLRSLVISFIILSIVLTTIFALLKIKFFYILGLFVAAAFAFFVLFSQTAYPAIYVSRRQKNIERNLIPALNDMMIQLNSGIPLFSILVNVSLADYGELSEEFKKAVRRISSGEPEAGVLDSLGERNPSLFFRRTLWQISSGMKSGADMAIVIEDSISALNEEQLIQIQNYGNKLNPLIVFYMLIAVIVPSLSITFLTIISSVINLNKDITTLIFLALFVGVVLIQIMFLGLIKSRRPSLL